jgi:hypothetical protein
LNTFKNPKAQKILGFLHAKNLLWARNTKPVHLAKIPILDAIWVGTHIEPRVLEVLPAALLHYPKTFLLMNQIPEDFKKIVENIRKGNPAGPDYKGILYKDMFRWANFRLKDQRTKKQNEKKLNITFRIRENHKAKLRQIAKKQNITITTLLENWIESA